MTHVRRKAIAILGAVLVPSAMMAPAASAAPADPPPGVTITVVSFSQDCWGGEVSMPVTATSFTVRYWGLHALAGGDSTPAESRQKCQVVLRVDNAVGFTYAISRLRFAGSAEVAAGATGELKTQHNFQGTPPSQEWTHKVPGPHAAPWTFDQQIPLDQVAFKPCGEERLLYLDTEMGVSAGDSDPSRTSIMALDTPDDSATYDLLWKTCP
ncbi:DUF4360 domain-containing protein [Actinomadura sp. KC06]|uniref:DUF4360 domain-containing protein n=1 Tax=Actinomadura sp. KC06 TaxID=2530369 RepID=UPI0010532A64|nr:DUF4360 domain-containing protein [Actinomadura sp. KC06]TDD39742.1 DUF4360 domain-containing protein [Actinomadura sp. KC06]